LVKLDPKGRECWRDGGARPPFPSAGIGGRLRNNIKENSTSAMTFVGRWKPCICNDISFYHSIPKRNNVLVLF
jgi:hypothetical protein